MSDLIATVLTLRAVEDASLTRFQGRALHALFFDLLARADAGLSRALHDLAGVKPVTLSDLIGPQAALQDGQWRLSAGDTVRWRVTLYQREPAACWLTQVLPALPERISLGDAAFEVAGWTADGTADRWAGATTYADLAGQALLAGPHPGPWIGVRFASPTTFRSQGMSQPLPLPGLAFGHWWDKWQAFAPLTLPDVREVAAQQIAISRFELRSEPVSFGNRMEIGAVGFVNYHVLADDPYLRRVLAVLSRFAFFAGTGHHTTTGLGQTLPMQRRATV